MFGADNADPSLLDQFGPWVVPGVIALVGVWLGKVWERGSARSAWLTDKRLAAYSRLGGALQQARTSAFNATAETGAAGRDDRCADMRRLIDTTPQMFAEIGLLGPKPVHDASGSAIAALIDFHQAVVTACTDTAEGVPVEVPQDANAALGGRMEDFMARASHALG